MDKPNSNSAQRWLGWLGVAVLMLGYVGLYAANYLLPIHNNNYTNRIWDWSQAALTIAAGLVILRYWRSLAIRPILIGVVLAVLSALSHGQHNPSSVGVVLEGLAVWACFVAGVILFKERQVSALATEASLATLGKSLGLGISLAIPLTVLNNLYFYMNSGSIQFQGLFASAFAALSPSIHEEIIFRFFVLALVFYLLRFSASGRWAMPVALCLAIVPHSLNHLPVLFLDNPFMGLVMLVATSLLFGLPMALLQVKRNLETAIAFHWFIDFVRFWFGF